MGSWAHSARQVDSPGECTLHAKYIRHIAAGVAFLSSLIPLLRGTEWRLNGALTPSQVVIESNKVRCKSHLMAEVGQRQASAEASASNRRCNNEKRFQNFVYFNKNSG